MAASPELAKPVTNLAVLQDPALQDDNLTYCPNSSKKAVWHSIGLRSRAGMAPEARRRPYPPRLKEQNGGFNMPDSEVMTFTDPDAFYLADYADCGNFQGEPVSRRICRASLMFRWLRGWCL
jgi:hypothetical protein